MIGRDKYRSCSCPFSLYGISKQGRFYEKNQEKTETGEEKKAPLQTLHKKAADVFFDGDTRVYPAYFFICSYGRYKNILGGGNLSVSIPYRMEPGPAGKYDRGFYESGLKKRRHRACKSCCLQCKAAKAGRYHCF